MDKQSNKKLGKFTKLFVDTEKFSEAVKNNDPEEQAKLLEGTVARLLIALLVLGVLYVVVVIPVMFFLAITFGG